MGRDVIGTPISRAHKVLGQAFRPSTTRIGATGATITNRKGTDNGVIVAVTTYVSCCSSYDGCSIYTTKKSKKEFKTFSPLLQRVGVEKPNSYGRPTATLPNERLRCKVGLSFRMT